MLLACILTLPLLADEGMWLFNQFPRAQLKQKYGQDVPDTFLEQLRLSSLRVGGGSGSFVSPNGLIFTNHHVASDCIAKLGSASHDYMKDGFSAASPAQELSCPDMEANVLVALENVTTRVKDVAKDEIAPAEALQKRRAAIASIEQECREKTGNDCSVVKLFSGERYDLYQYHRYTDLRLVFAPEFGIAFFGGDVDNFTYPRYDFDIAFLRAYENGRPASTPHYLTWSAAGVKDADLVFVSGNPGTTSRLATGAQLSFFRDAQLPLQISRLQSRRSLLLEYSAQNDEKRRNAQSTLSGLSNSLKALTGRYLGLKDQRLMQRKLAFEKRLRKAVENDPKLGMEAAKIWDEVALAYKTWAPLEKPFEVLERPAAQGSTLFRIARQLVRLAAESAKPNDQRLTEFRDSGRKTLELALYSPARIDEGLEIVLLTQYFEELKSLGEKEAPVKAILQGRTSKQAAEAFVRGSKLKDVAERKRLAANGPASAGEADPMLQLAQLLEAPARKLRSKYEQSIEALETSSVERIARYRFKVTGANDYPDATFTPRVSFGVVKAYRDKTEAPVPYATTFGGLYHRAGDTEPYILPQRWVDSKSALDAIVPLNFVSTCDITGGNSGSATVNASGEIVGIVFDTNIESLPATYLYTEEQARSVHVASQGILEVLKKVYGATALLKELGR